MPTPPVTIQKPVEMNGCHGSCHQRPTTSKLNWNDILVPQKAGTGAAKLRYRRRTLIQYTCLFTVGLATFYRSQWPALRATGLGLLFPGAGLVAVCTVPSILAFVGSVACIPLALFYWMGMGGILFPIALWISTAILAGFLAQDAVLESAGAMWTAVCICGIGYLVYKAKVEQSALENKRHARNTYLAEATKQGLPQVEEPQPGAREVDEKTFRFIQWILELSLSPRDDWSYHDVGEAFEGRMLKLQLFEVVRGLGLYQSTFCPNFHGYLSQAQRNCIEKSTTRRAMGIWKWEAITGQFNLNDWDPIKKDNLMVTGYILQAIGIYQSNTGDDRYSKKNSVVFNVTDDAIFKYDFPRLADAVYDNMSNGPYCLYSCQPGWVFPSCNLVGFSGLMLAEQVLGKTYSSELWQRFENALETEFSKADGSILNIRSSLTGLTVPVYSGALYDVANALRASPSLPHIAYRNYLVSRKESTKWTDDDQLQLVNVLGYDKLDPRDYKPASGAIHPIFAAAAAEFGDYKLQAELVRQLDEEYHPVFRTDTGALRNRNLSVNDQAEALRGRLCGYRDWAKMIQEGPPDQVFKAPVLDKVPFPEVLVAKAYSPDGESVDLVLYNGKEPGAFRLGFTRLRPDKEYKIADQLIVAASDGTAEVSVEIKGRTSIKLQLAKKAQGDID